MSTVHILSHVSITTAHAWHVVYSVFCEIIFNVNKGGQKHIKEMCSF